MTAKNENKTAKTENLTRIVSLLAIGSVLAACAAASGYDPNRYAGRKVEPADPDTQPLPSEPKTTIPDPKSSAPAAASTPAPTPAPAPTPEPTAAAAPKAIAAAPKPTTAAPTKAPTPDAADCGTKDNPCPMQKLMKGQMAAAQTPEALEAAFHRVAGLSPSGGWAWASIAKKGAELAKAGDIPGAKAQCKACHDQHKDAYEKQFRAQKL
jgi:hypothetical protein